MTHILRTLGSIAAAVLVTTLLGAGAASAGETDPMAGAPEVDSCYDLSFTQVYAHSVPEGPVDCSDTHTSVVSGLGKLPSGLTWSSPEKKISAAVFTQCERANAKVIGANPVLTLRSAYTWMWFRPTKAEEEAGARWFSCHTIAPEDKALTDLPTRLPKASKNLPDELAKCFVGRKYLSTTCADRHDWRMTYSVLVHKKYTDKNVDAASHHYCPAHVSTTAWLLSVRVPKAHSFVLGCSAKTHR